MAKDKTTTKYKPPAAGAVRRIVPKKQSHAEFLAAWTRNGSKFGISKKIWSNKDIDRNRTACAGQPEERPDAGVVEEEEDVVTMKASDLARSRMRALAEHMQMQASEVPDAAESGEAEETDLCATASPEELQALVDCRRSQLDELELLESMFAEEFCPLYDPAAVDELRASLEADGAEALRSVAAHPPLELLLQMTVPDQRSAGETDGKQLVASILLHVAFPPTYPSVCTPPELRFEDIMVSDALEEISSDKVVLPVVSFDEKTLVIEMQKQAADILPGNCVYEMVSWMSDNAFSYVCE